MTKRIAAIVFIFVCTSIAWFVLGGTMFARSEQFGSSLRQQVSTTWGTEQVQSPPTAAYTSSVPVIVERLVNGKNVSEETIKEVKHEIPLLKSDIDVSFDLEHRQKGLLWYSTYKVSFLGNYAFENNSSKSQTVSIDFSFPAGRAIYDDFRIIINGRPITPTTTRNGSSVWITMASGERVEYSVGYRSQGLDRWTYKLGSDVTQVRDFNLRMKTNFLDIDFPENSISPTEKKGNGEGWDLRWSYKSLLSGFDISLAMPQKLQPGPLAGKISVFAPVSLFFFFFLILIITTLRGIELHPMNYFFLAAAFFAFHLLMAYLVDHISIHLTFLICSAVSIFLVVSYLRLVAGMRFAAVEAGISQFIYLVLFSYAFFFKGFTGLAITIGSILTLFAVMQMTGRIRWAEKFK